MLFHTFEPYMMFPLHNHKLELLKDRVLVTFAISGYRVLNRKFGDGLTMKFQDGDFRVGRMFAAQVFTKQVDMAGPDADIWYEPEDDGFLVIAASDRGDKSTWHCYRVDKCPIIIARIGTVLDIQCPCTKLPCENDWYRFGG